MKFNIPPVDPKTKLLNVVIETPRESHNKYALDESSGLFLVKRALPAGMSFPLDFGFLPGTLGGDGDPLDVLVIQPHPSFPGCLVRAKLLGIIRGMQSKGGGKEVENDRLVALATTDFNFESWNSIADLPGAIIPGLAGFFENYNRLGGKKFRVTGTKGPGPGWKAVQRGVTAHERWSASKK